MAKFKQACFAHDLSKKFHTFYTQVIFGCTRHSSNKFVKEPVTTLSRWKSNTWILPTLPELVNIQSLPAPKS